MCKSLLAQNMPDPEVMSFSLEQLAKAKVYTASRHLEDSRQAPSAVTVISAEEIHHYGWRTLADVLRSVRGFYTAYDRDYSYLGVRGFLRSGDYNSRILLLINGHRINDNVFDSAHVGTEFVLDLDLVDHIEIVRGPSSSLFGTNAVFGVINVITRRPHSGLTVEASGETSTFLGRSGRVTASLRRDAFSGLLSASLFRSAGQENIFFPEFASPATHDGIAHNVDGDSFGHLFADLQAGPFRIQGLHSRRSKLIPTGSYDTIFNDPTAQSQDIRDYLDVAYHRSLSSSTDVDLRTYYDAYDSIAMGAYEWPLIGRLKGVGKGHASWVGTEATVEVRFGPHRLTAGANYEHSFAIDQHNYAEGLFEVLKSHRTLSMAAGFAEAKLNLLPRISVHAGGRIDWFDAYGTALSPRLALVYSPNSHTALKYIFGRAFRAPNAYESYYADGVVMLAPPTPLKPENIQSHELVFERTLAPWLIVTAEGFYNSMENLIDEHADPDTGLIYFANHGRDRSQGVESELQARHPSGWEGRASYTFVDARDQLGKVALANSPKHLAKFNGTAPVTRKAFAGLELLHSSTERSYQGTRVPSWWLTNFTFSTKPMWGGWELSASCYNVFNRAWLSTSGPELRLLAVPQEGRAFRFKLDYTFHREAKQ